MNNPNVVWLTSYPRSGNTLLRTILWQCFGLRSASIYPNDHGGSKKLEEYVGHIEQGADKFVSFPKNNIPLVKTHEYPRDQCPAIYVIRDGRAASVSLWEFYGRKHSLETIINGQHQFGTWSNHVMAWNPWERPNTLLLRYEDMTSNLPLVLNNISTCFNRNILKHSIPDRNIIASGDGRWVRKKSDWKSAFSNTLLKRFNEKNKIILEKGGYLD